jgi:hypothetical protein
MLLAGVSLPVCRGCCCWGRPHTTAACVRSHWTRLQLQHPLSPAPCCAAALPFFTRDTYSVHSFSTHCHLIPAALLPSFFCHAEAATAWDVPSQLQPVLRVTRDTDSVHSFNTHCDPNPPALLPCLI